jgi:hypothetical protein
MRRRRIDRSLNVICVSIFFCYLLNYDRTAHNDEIELPLYISFIPKKFKSCDPMYQ